jgi:short-subunit dehydrogenase
MRMRRAMTAQEVATATINALGHSASVLPGTLTKLLRSALVTAPRFMQVRIIGKMMKGFALKH